MLHLQPCLTKDQQTFRDSNGNQRRPETFHERRNSCFATGSSTLVHNCLMGRIQHKPAFFTSIQKTVKIVTMSKLWAHR